MTIGNKARSAIFDDSKIVCTRLFLKENLKNLKMHNFDSEKSRLKNIILRTVRNGESESVLIIGPRGCGKTTFIQSCMAELLLEFKKRDDHFMIRLHGLLHTNDNLALRAIIQQLNVKTLSGCDMVSGSFADNLMYVVQALRAGGRNVSKPIVIIIEDFHLFCIHRNQTLLYNLFDVAQSAQTPLCVIGVTSRVDIPEMLEKRIKSRFSHRQVLLLQKSTLEERLKLVRSGLSLVEHPHIICELGKNYITSWNENVDKVINEPKVIQLFKRQLEIEPNAGKLSWLLILIICKISSFRPMLSSEIIEEVLHPYSLDNKVEMLKDLSVLEFSVIIAIYHHNEIYDGEPFNFEMILKEYMKFARQNYSIQITQRPILWKAYERLQELELITPLNQGMRPQKKEYQLYALLATTQQVKQAINTYPGLPTDIAQWANSSAA